MNQERFRIIPYYTADKTLDEALKNPKSLCLLWLEILFNGVVSWEDHLDQPQIQAAYEKACAWYSRFKTMVNGHVGWEPLERRPEDIDMREYRKFLVALSLRSEHSPSLGRRGFLQLCCRSTLSG